MAKCGQLLVRCGYRVKVLNTINFSKSHALQPVSLHPFGKGHFEAGQYASSSTPRARAKRAPRIFGSKRNACYYTALIGYIWYEAPDDEMNFTTLLEMINASEAREDDPEFQNPVDLMFERAGRKRPGPLCGAAVPQIPAGGGQDPLSSILISCGARLSAL